MRPHRGDISVHSNRLYNLPHRVYYNRNYIGINIAKNRVLTRDLTARYIIT